MQIAGNDIKTYALDHHGLVAGICRDLKISERIDGVCGWVKNKCVSHKMSCLLCVFANKNILAARSLTPQTDGKLIFLSGIVFVIFRP